MSEQQNKRGFSQIPDIIWAPLTAGLLILIVSAIALLADQPWLFPSLGPTVFLQTEEPQQKSARFYNTVVGHLHGLVAGFLAVLLLGAGDAPPVLSNNELTPVRMWAAVLAIAVNMLLGFLTKASHPPAAATTLLIALGSFKTTWNDALTIMIGVLLIAIFGEIVRRVRLGQNLLASSK